LANRRRVSQMSPRLHSRDLGPSRVGRVFLNVGWLPSYRRAWLGRDAVSGVIIMCLLVPEGMAYAQIAGIPLETAFYVVTAGAASRKHAEPARPTAARLPPVQ
jgi:Sulfate permease family